MYFMVAVAHVTCINFRTRFFKMSNGIPLKLVSSKLSESSVTTVKKRTATSKSGINRVLQRVRENLESSWSNGSVQSLLFYVKNNEKDSQVTVVGFGPDCSKYVESEEFFPFKKKITNEMKSWGSVSCGASHTLKKKTCSDGEEITGGDNATKTKVPPVNWKNLDKQARLQSLRDHYGRQKNSTTLTSTITDTNSLLQKESEMVIAVEEVQFSEIVSEKAEETFRPFEEEQSIEIEKNGKRKKNQLSKEKVKKKKEELKRKPKEAVTRDKEKHKTGEAVAKEEEKRKEADAMAKEEEKRKEADAMAKDEEKRKIDEVMAKNVEKRKMEEALTKEEEMRKEADAMAKEEEKRKIDDEKRKIDEEKRKIEDEKRKIDKEKRKIDEEKRKIEDEKRKMDDEKRKIDEKKKKES